MELDSLNQLANGNTTLAWIGAVALAAGGTAVVVAAYIHVHRLKSRLPGKSFAALWRARGRGSDAAAKPACRRKTAPAPAAKPDAAAGLAAYQALRDAGRSSSTKPSEPEPGLEALDALLRRLRSAAESLEEIALRSGRLSGTHLTYDSFASGLDVEYLHRQN